MVYARDGKTWENNIASEFHFENRVILGIRILIIILLIIQLIYFFWFFCYFVLKHLIKIRKQNNLWTKS